MNKKFLLLTAALFALFQACSDNVVLQDPEQPIPPLPEAPPNINVETTAKLTVVVTDAVSGAPLNATVTLLSTGQAVPAVGGTAVFDSLHLGTYSLKVENGAGYASRILTATINAATTVQSENILVAQDQVSSIGLPPLTSGLTGYLFYRDVANKLQPATGAPIRIVIGGNYMKKIYETTVTGADGKFAFDSLPAVDYNYTLFALEFTVGTVTYPTSEYGAQQSLQPGTSVHEPTPRVYSEDISLFTLIGYTNTVDSAGAVGFKFSGAVDRTKIGASSITFSNSQTADITWNASNDSLTLKPRGKWSAASFNVTLNLRSVGGKTYNQSNLVTVVGNPLTNSAFRVLPPPLGYKTSVDSTETPIVIKFSDTIDVHSVGQNWVTVKNGSTDVAVNITWGGDSLILAPIGGKWLGPIGITLRNDNYPDAVKSVRNRSLSYDGSSFSINLKFTDPLLASPFTLLGDNATKTIGPKDAIVFEFSDVIDTKQLPGITFSGSQLVNKTLDNGTQGTKLTITPVTKWVGAFTVYFSNSIKSIRDQSLSGTNRQFQLTSPDLSLQPITGFVKVVGYAANDTTNWNSTQARLSWNKVDGATSYSIYRRYNYSGQDVTEGNFVFSTTTSDTTVLANIPQLVCDYQFWCGGNYNYYSLINGREIEYVVQATNDNNNTSTVIDTNIAVKVFDLRAPSQTTYGGAMVNGSYRNDVINGEFYTLTTGSTENALRYGYDDTQYLSISFNEPIDTLSVPLPAPATYGRLTVTPSWQPNTDYWNSQNSVLRLTLEVAAGDPITEVMNFAYPIPGFKDKRGNTFVQKYWNSVTSVLTETNQLDLRFNFVP